MALSPPAVKTLSRNLHKCSVLLSRNDVPNYFRSKRKKPIMLTSENKRTNVNNEMTFVSDLITSSIQDKAAKTVMIDMDTTFNDIDYKEKINCNSIHFKVSEASINSSAILSELNSGLNSCISHEIQSGNSSHLFKNGTASSVPYSNYIQNSFKSPSLPLNRNFVSLFSNNDTSNNITPLNKNSSVTVICHEDLTVDSVELPMDDFNQNSFQSDRSKNCSLIKNYDSSPDDIDREEFMDEELSLPLSKNSPVSEICHEKLSTDCLDLSVNNFNQNSYKFSRSENCSMIKSHVTSSDYLERVDSTNTELPSTFQNSLDMSNNMSIISEEFPIKNELSTHSMKRDSREFSSKVSCTKPSTFFSTSSPLKWGKSSLANLNSLQVEQKLTQRKSHIPVCPVPEFQKTCSSIVGKEKKALEIRTTFIAPVRVRGRTSNSKAFFKNSCRKDLNENRNSSNALNKNAESALMSPINEKTENYISARPLKIYKQHKKKLPGEVHNFCSVNEVSSDSLISSQKENDLDSKQSKMSLPSREKTETAACNVGGSNRKFNCTSFVKANELENGCITQHFVTTESEKNSNLKNNRTIVANSGSNNKDFIWKKNVNNCVVKINHSSSKDFMDNSSSDVLCSPSGRYLNSLEKTNISQKDLLPDLEAIPELLPQCKQVTPPSIFFDFLKKSSAKNNISRLKEFIDKQSIHKAGSKLYFERERLYANKTKKKFKNKHKKQSINNTDEKLKNNCQEFHAAKSGDKLKNNVELNANKSEKSEELQANEIEVTSENKSKKKCRKKRKPKSQSVESKKEIKSPISDVLHGIESLKTTDIQVKDYVLSLTSFLTNPLHSQDMKSLIFYVINFLLLTKENYLFNMSPKHSVINFLPPAEICVVEALSSIQNESKFHMDCLVKTVIHTLHRLVLTKLKIQIYGIASLCRVFAELCKRNDDKTEALSLCCDILKVKHKFGAYLITSIVAVWKEPFVLSDCMSDEDILLLKCLSFILQKKPATLSKLNWNSSVELLSELIPNVPDIDKAIEFYKDRILANCLENSIGDLWIFTSPFLNLLAQKPWDWIKIHIIDKYIIPNLQRFSRHVSKEAAFDVYCNLCVDVLLFNAESDEDKVLNMFYENLSLTGKSFVRDCLAVSLMKYFILSKKTVPSFLENWFKNNQDNPKLQVLEKIFQERLMSDQEDILSMDDIVV